MNRPPLEREALFPRLDGIQRNLQRLKKLSQLPLEKFSEGDPYDLAQHHLRLALEGVFHISSHILSRIPGSRVTEYKEIALKMGELHLVDKDFAQKALVPMAGMRNLLVHQYADIDPAKLLAILQNNLTDIEKFLYFIKKILKDPKAYGLEIN